MSSIVVEAYSEVQTPEVKKELFEKAEQILLAENNQKALIKLQRMREHD